MFRASAYTTITTETTERASRRTKKKETADERKRRDQCRLVLVSGQVKKSNPGLGECKCEAKKRRKEDARQCRMTMSDVENAGLRADRKRCKGGF